jgi:23S rRNA (uridine2552-2'-O)-methyltransferase
MAPNMSGHKSVDLLRSIGLAELALDFAREVNARVFVIKLFQGEGFEAYLKTLRAHFTRVVMVKPEASRSRSSEMYAVCVNKPASANS